jgi:hypothetical protein
LAQLWEVMERACGRAAHRYKNAEPATDACERIFDQHWGSVATRLMHERANKFAHQTTTHAHHA